MTFYADHTGFGQAQRNCNTGRKILIFGTDTHTHTHTTVSCIYIYRYRYPCIQNRELDLSKLVNTSAAIRVWVGKELSGKGR